MLYEVITRVVYTVTADADLGAGLILTNAATATLYYSFDDEAVALLQRALAIQERIFGPDHPRNNFV